MWISILPMSREYPEIWDDLQVPSFINKDDLIDKINMDCAELELVYSDPVLLKYMIKNWSHTEQHVWEKLADTMDLQYNPIYNLDVTWEETRTPDLIRTRTPNLTETRSPDLTNQRTNDDTITDKVQGFNDTDWADARRTSSGGNVTDHQSGVEQTQHTGNETETEKGKEVTVNRRFGNQGVTMTQDMIEKERDVVQFNLYDYICKSFKNRFCLLVY